MKDYRKVDDEFKYDIIVVPSIEDALYAILLNFSIQVFN